MEGVSDYRRPSAIVVPKAQNPWESMFPDLIKSIVGATIMSKLKQKMELEPLMEQQRTLQAEQAAAHERNTRVQMGQEFDPETWKWKQPEAKVVPLGSGYFGLQQGGRVTPLVDLTEAQKREAEKMEAQSRLRKDEMSYGSDLDTAKMGEQYNLMLRNQMAGLGATLNPETQKYEYPQAKVVDVGGEKMIDLGGGKYHPFTPSVLDAEGKPKMGPVGDTGQQWIMSGPNSVSVVNPAKNQQLDPKAAYEALEKTLENWQPARPADVQKSDWSAEIERKRNAARLKFLQKANSPAEGLMDAYNSLGPTMPVPAPDQGAKKYASPVDVAADKSLSRDEKVRILREQFPMEWDK